jgi:hypothetical protein
MDVQEVVRALRTLGCEGPAAALDTLRASGAYVDLRPHEVAEVLHSMTQVMIQLNRERNLEDG